MNKQEWKTQYQAARMLLGARYYTGGSGKYDTKEPARKRVWDICYQQVLLMHPSIQEALFVDTFEFIYRIDEHPHKWAIKSNLEAFYRKMPVRESKLKWRKP